MKTWALAVVASFIVSSVSAASCPDAPFVCSAESAPVCGSDGNTYSNECELQQAKCFNEKPNLTVLAKGVCRGCPEITCEDVYIPVCGSDGKTYTNSCVLEQVKCLTGNTKLAVASKGACSVTGPSCPPFCHEIYAPVCGSDGVTYGNQCSFDVAKCQNPTSTVRVVHTGECEAHGGNPNATHPQC